MRTLTKADELAIQTLAILPNNTVMIIANVNGRRMHERMDGEEIKTLPTEVRHIVSAYTHDSDENK